MTAKAAALLALVGLALAACAAKRPVLYPNRHLQEVGSEQGQADVHACLALAGSYVGRRSEAAEVAGSTAGGSAAGAVVGAAAGAAVGHAGSGAAAGAAGGGARGLLHGLFGRPRPDPVTRRFVEQCLQERGYHTIGWR